MATSKLPLPVSSTVAVESTRIDPRMLPPTIIEAPPSEIMPPKPAIAAASIFIPVGLNMLQDAWYGRRRSSTTAGDPRHVRFWGRPGPAPHAVSVFGEGPEAG